MSTHVPTGSEVTAIANEHASTPPSSEEDRDELVRQIEGVAALRDPIRRRLYEYIGEAGEVGRDEAAHALGVRRAVAAFHLDRMVEHGLLDIAFRRRSDRSGPGAGRPAKLYRRSDRQLDVSVPARNYELAARLFADALEGTEDGSGRERLSEAAHDFGRAIGARARGGAAADGSDVLPAATEVLRDYGFEPYTEDGTVYLRNCPFHALAQEHGQLVCGMNLALLGGLVSQLDAASVEASLEPAPGRCCVVLRRRSQ